MMNYEQYPPTFEQASALTKQRPIPKDILEQLDILREQTPIEYRERFKSFTQTAAMLLYSDPIFVRPYV